MLSCLLSDYKVWKLLDIYVDEARFNQDLSNIDTFGLDETSVAKGHDYITLLKVSRILIASKDFRLRFAFIMKALCQKIRLLFGVQI
jgi:hypothetical protein